MDARGENQIYDHQPKQNKQVRYDAPERKLGVPKANEPLKLRHRSNKNLIKDNMMKVIQDNAEAQLKKKH